MNATIYIRKENEDKWNSIEDKSAFVNLALGGTDVPVVNSAIKQRKEIEKILEPHLTVMKEKKMATGDTDYKLCKHGAYPQFCKFAKPGKPCK